jgi:hypothetical protein
MGFLAQFDGETDQSCLVCEKVFVRVSHHLDVVTQEPDTRVATLTQRPTDFVSIMAVV